MTVREMRKQTGMSQQKFADYFHIPKKTLEGWEYGTSNIPVYVELLIERVLLLEGKLDVEHSI